VRESQAVVAHLIPIDRVERAYILRDTVEDAAFGYFRVRFLRHGVRQGDDNAIFDQSCCAQTFFRGNQVRRAALIIGSPAAPVFEFVSPFEIIRRRNGGRGLVLSWSPLEENREQARCKHGKH